MDHNASKYPETKLHANREWNRKNRRKRIDDLKRIKAETGCEMCGVKDPDVLTFDHIDPKQKSFSIANGLGFSFEKIMAEIRKCRVLCHNCHNKHSTKNKHRGRKQGGDSSPTYQDQPELF